MAKKFEGVSPQIAVIRTSSKRDGVEVNKVIELLDKLIPAEPDNYAHVYKDSGEGAKSCVGIAMLEKSRNANAQSTYVTFNLQPVELLRWLSKAEAAADFGVPFVPIEEQKIKGFSADANGIAPVEKLYVTRNPIARDGQPSRYPWFVSIENGTGRVQKNANGGTTCAKGSYTKKAGVCINLSDNDLISFLMQFKDFLELWKNACCMENFRAGIEAARAQSRKAYQEKPNTGKYTAPQPQGYSQQAGGQTPGAGYSAQPAAPNPAAFVPGYNAAPYPAQQPQQPTNPYAYGAPGPAGYNGQ